MAHAQPTIQWSKCFGGIDYDLGDCIGATSDGGFIVVGSSGIVSGDVTSNHGGSWSDYWIIKLDSAGLIEWQKSIGGSQTDWASCVAQTRDGGYIVAGGTRSHDGDVSGNHGRSDCWIVKLSSQGVMQWQKCYGGSGDDYALGIAQTFEGGYVFVATSQSQNGDLLGKSSLYADCWVVKLDTFGVIEWQRSFGGSDSITSETPGGSIAQTSDGGFIVAATTDATDGDVHSSHGGAGGWVIRLDASGRIVWEHMLGDTSTSGFGCEEAHCIIQTRDKGFMVVGSGCILNVHGVQYWAVKLDSSGSIEWQKYYGGGGGDNAWSVVQTSDGGYVLAGDSGSDDGDVTGNHPQEGGLGIPSTDAWIVKIDSVGELLWEQSYGGTLDDYAGSILQMDNGAFVFAGYTGSVDGDVNGNHSYYYDIWVVKLAVGPSAVPEKVRQPIAHRLDQNYPNPFAESTQIPLSLSEMESRVATLRIYNTLGELVQDLTDQVRSTNNICFTAEGISPGVYSCVLEIKGSRQVRQLLVIR